MISLFISSDFNAIGFDAAICIDSCFPKVLTTSLFSSWDNQFYPEIRKKGGVMVMIDCDPDNGGMSINPDFMVNFGNEPNGPSRCHEMRYPGGDCTSDIWL